MQNIKTANERLIEKMNAEFNGFLDYLRSLSVEEALEHSYEKTMKEDLVFSVMDEPLSERKARALLKKEHPLEECFIELQKSEYSYMPGLRAVIEYRASVLEHRSRGEGAR